jgi:hypothetical protein
MQFSRYFSPDLPGFRIYQQIFTEVTQYQISLEIYPVGATLMYAGRRTDSQDRRTNSLIQFPSKSALFGDLLSPPTTDCTQFFM